MIGLKAHIIMMKEIAIFSGKENGANFRKENNLDELDNKDGEFIHILVPACVLSINTSFFRAAFTPSIKKFGREGFEYKYRFITTVKNIELCIIDGIESSIRWDGINYMGG